MVATVSLRVVVCCCFHFCIQVFEGYLIVHCGYCHINCYYIILAAVEWRCTGGFPFTDTFPEIPPTILAFTRGVIESTFSGSLCYCIPKECGNPSYTKNIKGGFLPSIAKSIYNHLHSNCRSNCCLILATLPTLSTWYTWLMLYFLLLFLIALCRSCRIILLASISDSLRCHIIHIFTFILTHGLFLICINSHYDLEF